VNPPTSSLAISALLFVIPAKAGTQTYNRSPKSFVFSFILNWTPTFARVTRREAEVTRRRVTAGESEMAD